MRLFTFAFLIFTLSGLPNAIVDGFNCSYIVTTNGTCVCPNSTLCKTLDWYILNQITYFTSNTTFCFLSGTHVLNSGSLKIENISNITFIGLGAWNQMSIFDKVIEFNFYESFDGEKDIQFQEPSAIIQCVNFSGFYFNSIYNLSVINITISDCGANVTIYTQRIIQQAYAYGADSQWYAAIIMINISNLYVDTVSIQNSTGYGLIGINVLGYCNIQGSSFVGNNQAVKKYFQLFNQSINYCVDGSYCPTCASPFYVSNASVVSPSMFYAGGNVMLCPYRTAQGNHCLSFQVFNQMHTASS